MEVRKVLGIAVVIAVLGVAVKLWGLCGIAVYLGIKILALVLLRRLWVLRRKVAVQDR